MHHKVPVCLLNSFSYPGSGAFWLLDTGTDPGYVFPDLGSPTPYFLEINNNLWVKTRILCQLVNIFWYQFKNKIICNFVKFMVSKKAKKIIFSHLPRWRKIRNTTDTLWKESMWKPVLWRIDCFMNTGSLCSWRRKVLCFMNTGSLCPWRRKVLYEYGLFVSLAWKSA